MGSLSFVVMKIAYFLEMWYSVMHLRYIHAFFMLGSYIANYLLCSTLSVWYCWYLDFIWSSS